MKALGKLRDGSFGSRHETVYRRHPGWRPSWQESSQLLPTSSPTEEDTGRVRDRGTHVQSSSVGSFQLTNEGSRGAGGVTKLDAAPLFMAYQQLQLVHDSGVNI